MDSQFVISSTEAASLASSLNLSLLSLLPTLVPSSLPLARPPISAFPVAAVGLSSDNRIFLGVNLEFPSLPLHHSVHAEQFLIASLAAHGGGRLIAIAVSAAPCGHCRQFLQELRSASELQICVVDDDVAEFRPLIRMLPEPFGPFDLLDSGAPLLLEPKDNCLSVVASGETSTSDEPILVSSPVVTGVSTGDRLMVGPNYGSKGQTIANSANTTEKLVVGPISSLENGPHVDDHSNPEESCTENASSFLNGSCNGYCEPSYSQLETGALEAANRSHAPYSNCPSGVALMDRQGKIYKGSYTESAAYNPSLGPVQAAVVAYVAGGGGGYGDIVAGVLVEREGAVVRQEETARLLLKLIAPKCELRVIHCRSD